MTRFILGLVLGITFSTAGTFAFDYSKDQYGVQTIPPPLHPLVQHELMQQQMDRMQRSSQPTNPWNPC